MRPLARLLFAALLTAAPGRGQDAARWVADLGDAARGEGAEIALVGIGERAAPLMIDVLREANDDAAARRQRQLAALRVLALLGPDAAAVGSDLAGFAPDRDLVREWWDARAALEPWAGAQNVQNPVHIGEWMNGAGFAAMLAAVWRMQGRPVSTGGGPGQCPEPR